MPRHDLIIIGAGQNSVVIAFYLARAGFKPLVLERRPVVGGAAVTEEFHPGFRASILDAVHGPLASAIARDMELDRHGVQFLEPAARVFAPHPDGRALLLHSDARKSAAAIAPSSKSDAAKYTELSETLDSARALIRDLLLMTPPEINKPTSRDLWNLLRAGKAFRGLRKKNMQRLIRWGPMAVADFVAEFFETELLRATIAARGIFGAAAGPWSAGTTALLLLRCGAGGLPDGGSTQVRGGAGALSNALAAAAKHAGAEIRTKAEVARILVKDGAVSGVALTTGEEIPAKAVVSGADPKCTFLHLLEPVHLAPSFLQKMRNYRSRGVVARVLLALDALPNFTALKTSPDANAALAARIHIGPEIDYLERAFDASKYGDFSPSPYLEASVPSLLDPSLAPAGHVMSIHMQYAPYNVNASSAASREASPACHSEPARPSRSEEAAFRSGATGASAAEGSHLSGGRGFSPGVTNAAISRASAPEGASPNNWPSHRDALADAVIKTLAEYAPDLPSKIVARRVITPLDLEETYGLTGGHISHGELALDQLFTMRPLLGFARYATPIRGLFLCGSGTHPGVALAGTSGLNASRQIVKAIHAKPRHLG
ncbi:MAG: NAD(P)/FAD-dependent oxidoreductase [Candidatus Acidiferrales bacterium]